MEEREIICRVLFVVFWGLFVVFFFLLSGVLFCDSCQQVVWAVKIIYLTVQSTGFWMSKQPMYFGAMGSKVDPVRFLSDRQQ